MPASQRSKRLPHWRPTGAFSLLAAGTSYYRDAIAPLAGNPDGSIAFTFFNARLVPESANAADPMAVAIYHSESKIGHLPPASCERYRQIMVLKGYGLVEATMDAVVRNGLVVDGQTYNYRVLLDYPASNEIDYEFRPSFQEPVRLEPYAPLAQQADGSYTTHVWVDAPDRDHLDVRLQVHTWTTPDWTTVNFYVLNRQRIDLGFKVYQMPKALYESRFPKGAAGSLLGLCGRVAIMRVVPAE